MKMRRIIPTLLLVLFLLPLSAQERSGKDYVFRFQAGNDMFYVPFGENGIELQRLQECVERYKADILAGKIPLYVDGYSISAPTESENLTVAKTRSNRVKSELITRSALMERCFITHNQATDGNFVTVRLEIPAEKNIPDSTQTEPDSIAAEREQAEKPCFAAEREAARTAEEERLAAERAEQERRTDEEAARKAELERAGAERPASGESEKEDYTLTLRVNLLRWATLTPDLGFEWRINRHVGVLVNGSWISWSWDDKNRRYALWEVSPEVRWYLGERKTWYVGAMFKAGQFNYKFSETGRQGDLLGGGITGGYQLKLNKALSMDFSLGLGYVNADVENYKVMEGVRVCQGKETKLWFGPIQTGVTLVWSIF